MMSELSANKRIGQLWYNYGMEGGNMPVILPINKLKNTSEISETVHNSNEPVFITKNGYGDMVMMSNELYSEMMNKLKKLQTIKDLWESEKQFENGEYEDAFESLEKLRKKHGL